MHGDFRSFETALQDAIKRKKDWRGQKNCPRPMAFTYGLMDIEVSRQSQSNAGFKTKQCTIYR